MVEAGVPKWQLQIFCDRIREAWWVLRQSDPFESEVQDGCTGLEHVTIHFATG